MSTDVSSEELDQIVGRVAGLMVSSGQVEFSDS